LYHIENSKLTGKKGFFEMSFSVSCWLLMLYEKAKDFFLEDFESSAFYVSVT
jgi:hypothetical protein